jgi:alpha-tubulin suppressor-like RCC1 family protein
MLDVSRVRSTSTLAIVFLAASLVGCKLELIRDLSTAAQAPAPSAFSALGVTGGSDILEDTKLTDGLIPTLTWVDTTGETSYELRILDSTGSTTICGPATLPADSTSYTFSAGCSLLNGVTYKADLKALRTDGTLSSSTSAPAYSFQTGPFITIASSTNTQEYGVASVTVSLNQAAAVPVSVDYVTADQTAFGGTDYIHRTTTTLTFAPGETSKAISVPIFSNREYEGDRAFRVELSSPNSGSLESTTSSVTIQDDDLAPMAGFVSITPGDAHTCGVPSTGGLKCWGYNGYGELGDNSTSDRITPTDVSGLSSGVTAVVAAELHTCALLSTGGVKCWGGNFNGRLGDGSTTQRLTPVDVSGLTSGVTAIAAGANHTCALLSTGGLKCWGHNGSGQLGDGSTTHRLTPVDVSGLTSGVTAVSAGEYFTCARLATGGIKCWGLNTNGRLGDGTTTNRTTAVDVTGLTSGVAAISSRGEHACALLSTGGVKCWGSNNYGQVGDSSTTHRSTAVDATGLSTGVSTIATGKYHSCAILTSGATQCWGDNSSGQIGDGTQTGRPNAVGVSGLSAGVTQIALGNGHTCAVLASGLARCWGGNGNGKLGDGTSQSRLTPVSSSGLSSNVSALSASAFHRCAVVSGGVKCWGHNNYGQLGDGTTDEQLTLVDVVGLTSGVSNVMSGNQSYSCALLNSGGIKCWGYNGYGQLGDGTGTDRLTPVDVTGLTSGVIAIAAKGTTAGPHTCALLATGGVKCWGYNGDGRLGDGSTTNRLTPVDVSGLTSGVTAIGTGGAHTCALLATGGVKCWGGNGYGQLGDGTTTQRNSPVDVSGLTSGVAAISAGGQHTCALLVTGGVKCWGDNAYGQLGDNSMTSHSTSVDVSGLTSGISAITTGENFSCAILTSGGAKCWGDNWAGQLGDNSRTDRLTPVDVSGLASGVTAISAGTSHTCALLISGSVQCWGGNSYNVLADSYQNLVPQFVRTP